MFALSHRLRARLVSNSRSLTTGPKQKLVLSTGEAGALLQRTKDAVVLDASERNATEEYNQQHLPRSHFWRQDEIASAHPLNIPHMLPSPETFAEACEKRGTPRLIWTFKTFGHEKVALINGGLPKWISEKRYTDNRASPVKPANYTLPKLDPASVRSYEEMLNNVKLPSNSANQELILDARSAERFHGTAPEPRAGLSSGHLPTSMSLPFTDLLSAPSNTEPSYRELLLSQELRQRIEKAIGEDKLAQVLEGQSRVVATCGSGMTAAVIWLALQVLGAPSTSLYDESWTGWASRNDSPISKSE